jgi:tRNA (mo5U34)-methyltransferase
VLNPFDFVLRPRPDRVAELEAYIRKTPDWFHCFDFGDGIKSPGRDPSPKKLYHLCLPPRLDGLSVLDIGAYEGYFSFHCEQRGAKRVVASDRFVWEWPGGSAKRNFDAVKKALTSQVEPVVSYVEDLSTVLQSQTFDIVLFLGVLYHTPGMMQYLDSVYQMTKTLCILETFMDMLDQEKASASIYADCELNSDNSNWWGPNLRATTTMLRRAGFREVQFMNFWDVNTRDQVEGRPWDGPIKTGRAVLHAYK